MKLEDQIRELAKNSYYQEIYNTSKNCSNIQIFNNINNFSGIQYLFLYWLRVYSMLYDELYQKEWDNLDEAVIKDNIRTDAFLYYRRKQQEKKLKELKKADKKGKKSGMMKVFTGAKNTEKEGKK